MLAFSRARALRATLSPLRLGRALSSASVSLAPPASGRAIWLKERPRAFGCAGGLADRWTQCASALQAPAPSLHWAGDAADRGSVRVCSFAQTISFHASPKSVAVREWAAGSAPPAAPLAPMQLDSVKKKRRKKMNKHKLQKRRKRDRLKKRSQ